MRLSNSVEKEDVEEANRLILSAPQTAAVDPTTGRIDLDLVITGISASSRHLHDLKRKAIRNVIREMDRPNLIWADLYRSFNDQSDESLTETEFNSILRDLADEGFIHITGRSNAEKMIKKLQI